MKKRLNFCWRSIASIFCYVLFGIGAILLSLVFALLIRWLPVPEKKKQMWLLTAVHKLSAALLRTFELLGLVHSSRFGPSLASLRGHLILANHSTLVDALFVIADTRNLCCVVKAELLFNPFTRYIVKLAGYIPNNSATLLEDSSRALADGKNLLIFPEGTRNTFDEQLEFKRGAANIALSTQCLITPVILLYKPRGLQKGQPWYEIPEIVPQAVMASYPPLNSDHYIDQSRPVTLQVRQLNAGLVEFYRNEIANLKGKRPLLG